MAISEQEKAFFDAVLKHHEAGSKLAEDYLKKSDTATRPASVTSIAAGMVSEYGHQVERIAHMREYLEKGPNASKEAAARLMGGYDY